MELTIDMLQSAVPKSLKNSITDDMVVDLNGMLVDPMLRENFAENILGYTQVLQEGRFKIRDYISAVKYVSFKLLGASNTEAYQKTFPERWQRLVDDGADGKTIAAYSSAYNNNKLVNLIVAQTLVPNHVLNQDLYQKALNVQATLMVTAKSEMVRTQAANSILTQLKPPEATKIEMDISMKEDSSISELRQATLELVEQQKSLLAAGTKPIQIAQSQIIPTDEEVTDAEVT